MRTRIRNIALFSPLLLALVSGCATKALWSNGALDACKEPASNPHLRLFEAKSKNDLLVVYDESSERNDAVRTRAYWLNENRGLVDQRARPHFASLASARDLQAVPVFYDALPSRSSFPSGLCAVLASNKESFTVYFANRDVGTHDLPVYNDGKGRVAKIALTPVAATADVTIVGGYVLYLIWSSNPESYTPLYSSH